MIMLYQLLGICVLAGLFSLGGQPRNGIGDNGGAYNSLQLEYQLRFDYTQYLNPVYYNNCYTEININSDYLVDFDISFYHDGTAGLTVDGDLSFQHKFDASTWKNFTQYGNVYCLYHCYSYDGDGYDIIDFYYSYEDEGYSYDDYTLLYSGQSLNTSYFENSGTDVVYRFVMPLDLINYYFNTYNGMTYQDGYDDGYADGNAEGYGLGWAEGYHFADNQDAVASSIFIGIIDVALLPINFFLACLNFEVFGINIGSMVTALLTVMIVIIIVRVVFGGGNQK